MKVTIIWNIKQAKETWFAFFAESVRALPEISTRGSPKTTRRTEFLASASMLGNKINVGLRAKYKRGKIMR